MLKIVHSADWHLGASVDGLSLREDHAVFLEWLVDLVARESVDALLIAGDIFDSANPSADAQQSWYGFLAALRSRAPGVRTIVTGGNHDSPSRLEAPANLLEALSVTVVGGMGAAEKDRDRALVPLLDAKGEVAAVVAAVPYVHEHWLGVRAGDSGADGLRRAIQDAFSSLYAGLASRARERWGETVPLLAMGHLTVSSSTAEASKDDAPQEIHQIGTIDALRASIFGEEWASVCLGHIHRAYPVVSPHVWYAGTPIALNAREASTPRSVRMLYLETRVDGASAPEPPEEGLTWHAVPRAWLATRPRQVPIPRQLVHFEGTQKEIEEAARAWTWTGTLPPIVRATVRTEAWEPRVREAVEQHLRGLKVGGQSVLVSDVQWRRLASEEERAVEDFPSLEGLTPDEVFAMLYRARRDGEEPSDEMMAAFRSLVNQEHA